jgi:MFS superfamily sulfate permease-like transporter
MFNSWKKDLKSSLVVFLVALPLCLGIALASNAPLSAGIISGVIGGVIVGLLSGSQISVSGPANTLTVVIASGLVALGSYNSVALAIFIAGLIQIIFGIVRSGSIANYIPTAVIKGMLAAIGIILILKQVPHAVGYDVDYMGDESFLEKSGGNTFTQILNAFNSLHMGALIVSFLSLAIIRLWDSQFIKRHKKLAELPGPLVAIFSSVLLNEFLLIKVDSLFIGNPHLVDLPFTGGLNDLIKNISFPDWTRILDPKIYGVALSIALTGSLESLLSVDAADKFDEHGRFTNKNQELIAQGVGNSVCGLFGGVPIASVVVRSSVNVNAGAVTKLSSILHGLWILLSVILIPLYLNKIPIPVLSSILIVVGYRLAKPALFKTMYAKGRDQFIPFIITILAIIFSNLLIGIAIGVAFGLFFILKSNLHNSIVMAQEDNLYLIRFYKDVSFLQKSNLQNKILAIPEKSTVIIDGSNGVFVDNDIIDVLEDFLKRAESLEIKVEIKKSPLAMSPFFKEG